LGGPGKKTGFGGEEVGGEKRGGSEEGHACWEEEGGFPYFGRQGEAAAVNTPSLVAIRSTEGGIIKGEGESFQKKCREDGGGHPVRSTVQFRFGGRKKSFVDGREGK